MWGDTEPQPLPTREPERHSWALAEARTPILTYHPLSSQARGPVSGQSYSDPAEALAPQVRGKRHLAHVQPPWAEMAPSPRLLSKRPAVSLSP